MVSAINFGVPFVASVTAVTYPVVHPTAGHRHISSTAGYVTFLEFAVKLAIGTGTGAGFVAAIGGAIAVVVI